MSLRGSLKAVGGIVVVLVAAFALYVTRTWDRVYASPLPEDIHRSSDPAVIARGEYLVYGPAHCVECHGSSLDARSKLAEPWEAFARMTAEDLGAIYEFLHTLPPSDGPSGDPQFRKE